MEKKLYQLLTVIAAPKLADKAAELFRANDLPIEYRINGEGTASSEIMDMLGLGSDYRMNVPSVPNGNWSYQMKQGEFDDKLVAQFAKLNKKYGR